MVLTFNGDTYALEGMSIDDLVDFKKMIQSSCLTERRVFSHFIKIIDNYIEQDKTERI